MERLQEKFRGALIGLAVGDAVGTVNEFKTMGKDASVVTDMVGGGPFRLKPGEWTDDTSMALCLAASLIVNQGFNPADQLERYYEWYRNGYMSSNGVCFDIGTTTFRALRRFHQMHEIEADDTSPSCANGSIMRLAPVPMFFAGDARLATVMSALSSKTTHGNLACVYGCAFLGTLIEHLLTHDVEKSRILNGLKGWEDWTHVAVPVPQQKGVMRVMSVARGSFFDLGADSIEQTGAVWDTLEAALFAFVSTNSFRDGALTIANRGDDSDTVGAVFGQIAGAFYGIDGIPAEWVAKLAKKDLLFGLADDLYQINRGEEATFAVPQY